MGPRKKSKQQAKKEVQKTSAKKAEDEADPSISDEIPHNSSISPEASGNKQATESNVSLVAPPRSVRGWSGETWSKKSTPSTKVARESILADTSKNGILTADFSRFEPKKQDITLNSTGNGKPHPTPRGIDHKSAELSSEETVHCSKLGTPVDVAAADQSPGKILRPPQSAPSTASAWLGWIGYQGPNRAPDKAAQANPAQACQTIDSQVLDQELPSSPINVVKAPKIVSTSPNSWFGFWSSPTDRKRLDTTEEEVQVPVPDNDECVEVDGSERPSMKEQTEQRASTTVENSKGSSWGFWSKQPSESEKEAGSKSEHGELAVAGEASQDRPTPAHTIAIQGEPSKAAPSSSVKKQESTQKNGKTLAPVNDLQNTVKAEAATSAKSSPAPSIKQSKPTHHLLLPEFRSTYHLMDNPSILQQIARLLLHSHQPPANHVYLVKDPPRIRKALAIGIHGLFPASFLRPVIGQPTGTSIRFANHAADAIQRWAESHEVECNIEKVALEGEGKIAERVDSLWKLLLNWVDHVREADFILVACHSQGVPVAMMLVAKLIDFGVVSSARIAVCGMAGVSLGPFADYKARFFGGSTAELFEFADTESEVSKRYEQSLRIVLDYGVRITFVGSIDDQLVSLESAIFSPVNHPYIYRAVFVDGRVHAPDFIAHLVGFALKLRNLGISDHGLIRELSAPLAGSLYTGGGHSSLYDETRIYDLSIAFALETTSISKVPVQISKYSVPTAGTTNPFQLPWSMRGLLEEDVVKTELDEETRELLKQFDEWKPTTKGLKDVKYRLEAVRSKL